tara:strand:+ start:611 stop:1372 length:762 start_codon:yes stop_codon:yes gene_type:complete
MSRDGAIALYDSGRGVESVLSACRSVLPNEKWLILQDKLNQPYGTKCDQTIINAGFSCFSHLMKQKIKAVVVACHTSSAIALPNLRKHFALPIVGMLRPTARLLADQYTHDRIVWLATPASIHADRLEPLARQLGFSGEFHPIVCSEWAACIERGRVRDHKRLVKSFIDNHRSLLAHDRVKILYGCTHYPLLDTTMRSMLVDIETINPAQAVAIELHDALLQRHMLSSEIQPSVSFLRNIGFPMRPRLVTTLG